MTFWKPSYDEIMSDRRTDPLAEVRPPKQLPTQCYLELTLNYPRVASFANARSTKQKEMYMKIYTILKNTFGIAALVRSEHHFECCASGHVHLHALLEFKFDQPVFPQGVVADLVKTWLQCLPKKHNSYMEACMKEFDDGFVYRSPSIKCAFRSFDNQKRIDTWLEYIRKCV